MCLYYDHAKQANDNGLVLYCTLIDYVVSMYDTYNTIERMSTYDIIARVGGDIEMWLSHFFPTRELVS